MSKDNRYAPNTERGCNVLGLETLSFSLFNAATVKNAKILPAMTNNEGHEEVESLQTAAFFLFLLPFSVFL